MDTVFQDKNSVFLDYKVVHEHNKVFERNKEVLYSRYIT